MPKRKIWEGDGWEITKEDQPGRTPRTIFYIKRSNPAGGDWRIYSGRLSPHAIEIRFEKQT